jgi:hypothetical protein
MSNFLRRVWTRVTCPHKRWFMVAITFDGDAIYECAHCGKRKNAGMS